MADGKKSKKLPGVIDFAYEEFKTDEVKLLQWAKCKKCKAVIREKLGTTSAFVRHLSTAQHPNLVSE